MTIVESQAPWLDKMPLDWGSTRIRNVADLSPGSSNRHPERSDLCTIVPMEKLSDNGLIDISNQQSFEDVQAGLATFEEGDVLFAKITPCMENGKGAFVDQLPTKCAFGSTEFHVLRPRSEVNGRFLYYATFNPVFRAYAAENMTGAAGQKRVSSRFLKDTRLFLPGMTEQKSIAAYLDASCRAIDGAVAAKRLQIEILKALKTAFVLRAVTEGLNQNVKRTDHKIPNYGSTPQHWKRSKLRYEISVQNGDFVSDKLQDDGEYAVFGGNGIMGRTDKFNVDGETVIIGRVGAYCGNAQYVKGRVWISDNALIVKSRNHGRFLSHLFKVLNFNTQANKTAQPVITGTKIKNTYVVLPPKKEQEAISLFIEDKEAVFAEISGNLKTQIQTLLVYRKSLIHECVTGKRRITDADVARVQEETPEEWRRKHP